MLSTLDSQIHFVRDVQSVDTTGVAPLRSIRDETEEGFKESTITTHDLQETLGREFYVGRQRKIQRAKVERISQPDGDTWDGDALKYATKTMGKYYVVQSDSN